MSGSLTTGRRDYWHAKSSCYFDPKTKMFFNTKSNAWSKDGLENAPRFPAMRPRRGLSRYRRSNTP